MSADPRAEAMRRLPSVYASALRLRLAGLSAPAIAERLELDPAAIGPLLVMAEAKLAAVLEEMERDGGTVA